jgi:flagellar M-ring protein FliF
MADESNLTLFDRFSGYSRQPVTRQLALLFGLAASIAIAIGMVQLVMTPNYKPLYGAMAPEDTNDVISSSRPTASTTVSTGAAAWWRCPRDSCSARACCWPATGSRAVTASVSESLYREQEIGLSSFMEQARFQRALEMELSRTIAGLDSVRGARVHLAVAKPSAFLRQSQRPAASVMLSLYPGRSLDDRQLAGIVHLVASSVPNLEAQQVSVVDQAGKLLSKQGIDDDFGHTQEQFRYTRQLEDDYRQRIVDILTPIIGPDAVRAQVTADMDFTRIERTSESFAPETVIRSEQTSEEISNQRFAGGVPGSLSNEPPLDTAVVPQQPGTVPLQPAAGAPAGDNGEVAAAQPPPARQSRSETRNYEVDKTISHVRETPGSLRKLSIAVVLDYVENTADDGSVTRAPMAPERVDEITALVREAVGFSAERGDTVSVISASFVALPEPDAGDLVEPSLLEQDWVWQLAKGLMALIVLLALVFVVLRPVMKFSATPVATQQALRGPNPGAPPALAGGAAGAMADDQVTLGGAQQLGLPGAAGSVADYQQQLQMARSVATDEPARAAYVVKDWVAADG